MQNRKLYCSYLQCINILRTKVTLPTGNVNHIRIIVHGFTYMTHAEQKIVLFLPSMQKIYKSGI